MNEVICRVGSLENEREYVPYQIEVICRVGSLETLSVGVKQLLDRYLPCRQLRNLI